MKLRKIHKEEPKEEKPVKTSGCPNCAQLGVKVKVLSELLKHFRDNVVGGNQAHVDAINRVL